MLASHQSGSGRVTDQSAYQRLLDALRDHGSTVNESSAGQAQAQCPAHDDGRASLSIRRIDGSVLAYCHAGCQTADVLAAVKLSMGDLYDDRRGATYDYPDGRRVHRTPNKEFYQKGNTKGKALFHADRIRSAATVYVCEGEKDVLAVESVGAAAVCAAMGAGKANRFDWSPLRGKHAIIVADKDEPGRKHAAHVAELLNGIAATVRVVEAAAGKDAADHIAAGESLDELVYIEAESVDGAELLDDIKRFAGRFLAFPTEHHLVVLCLWIAHTWCVSAFYVTPRLVLDSPEPGSGKTRVLEVLALLCRAAKLTLSTTTAALYRRIAAAGDSPPTILQDEADAVFGKTANPQAEDLRALFNAGYKRGATVDRCEGDAKNMRVREFPVFAPVALAGLAGKMPATIMDRAVPMHMRRRAPDEQVAEYRERDAQTDANPLRERLAAWANASLDVLTAARPAMPEGVRDRPAEVWEALLAVADLAGGEWPERAREACKHFVLNTEPDDKLSLGLRLLRDVEKAFGDRDRMHSVGIVAALTDDEESEWRDLWGKPLDQQRLAKELKRYGVRSKDVRIDGGAAKKGYLVTGDDGLGQAWHRYLSDPNAGTRDSRDRRDTAGRDDSDPRQRRDSRDRRATAKTPSEQAVFDDVAPVALVAPTDGQSERRSAPGKPSVNGHRPATPEQHAAYRVGRCIDCHTSKPSAGRPRCEPCHRTHLNVMAGYDQ